MQSVMPTLYHQRAGLDGIRDTLTMMRALVNRAYTHEVIRTQAARVIQHYSPGDTRSQAASLLAWVHRTMQFIRDPHGTEALHDPVAVAVLIARGGRPFGDCDDMAMYLAALLKSVGLPAMFRAVGFHGRPPSHVYVIGPHGLRLDPTRNAWNPAPGELLKETSQLELAV